MYAADDCAAYVPSTFTLDKLRARLASRVCSRHWLSTRSAMLPVASRYFIWACAQPNWPSYSFKKMTEANFLVRVVSLANRISTDTLYSSIHYTYSTVGLANEYGGRITYGRLVRLHCCVMYNDAIMPTWWHSQVDVIVYYVFKVLIQNDKMCTMFTVHESI